MRWSFYVLSGQETRSPTTGKESLSFRICTRGGKIRRLGIHNSQKKEKRTQFPQKRNGDAFFYFKKVRSGAKSVSSILRPLLWGTRSNAPHWGKILPEKGKGARGRSRSGSSCFILEKEEWTLLQGPFMGKRSSEKEESIYLFYVSSFVKVSILRGDVYPFIKRPSSFRERIGFLTLLIHLRIFRIRRSGEAETVKDLFQLR